MTRNLPNLWNTEMIVSCSFNFRFVTLPMNLPLNSTFRFNERGRVFQRTEQAKEKSHKDIKVVKILCTLQTLFSPGYPLGG